MAECRKGDFSPGQSLFQIYAKLLCHSTVGITIFSYMMAQNRRTKTLFAPAIFRLVNPSESHFILKHESHGTVCGKLQAIYFVVNFFEVSMTSSLAFFGSLLCGMTFRQP